MTIPETTRGEFESLARRHAAELTQYAYVHCGSANDAGDVVQRAFLKGWQAYRSGARPLNVRAWLYRIVHNEASNHRREVQTRGRHRRPPSSSIPVGGGLLEEEMEKLLGCLRELPAPFKDLLALHYLQGLSISEVSELLDLPLGTAKSQLARGLALLRTSTEEGEDR
jgi:RNA polymerase sigma-70 factor (ECF subfamily)